jgi:hypothetical protein
MKLVMNRFSKDKLKEFFLTTFPTSEIAPHSQEDYVSIESEISNENPDNNADINIWKSLKSIIETLTTSNTNRVIGN